MKEFTGVVINVEKNIAEVVTIRHELEDIYNLLNVNCFTITFRDIGGKKFCIYCDDEGLLVSDPIVSAYDSLFRPALVGNLFVVSACVDEEGYSANLTEKECEHVLNHVGEDRYGNVFLLNCDY